jgi:orotidine-5'-phosphate decarboxylase
LNEKLGLPAPALDGNRESFYALGVDGHFADRYIEAARHLKNPLCVGLDPHLERIPSEFGVRLDDLASDASAAGVQAFFEIVVDVCAGKVPVVKPQIAFFEQLGWRGIRVLERVVARARERGLLVVLDVKRGDIGSTAQAYAASYLLPNSPCRADAVTLNAYLGMDSLQPFLDAARAHGAGLFVLARTSNPGAADFQSQLIDGVPLYERVARALARSADSLRGSSGWSALGVVAGATFPGEAARLRQVLPHSLFLVPGYGAQGAPVSAALASFVPRLSQVDGDRLEGGLVSSSRGILYGDGPRMDTIDEWRSGLSERLDAARNELAEAVAIRPEKATLRIQS